jgi:hypothetical protein
VFVFLIPRSLFSTITTATAMTLDEKCRIILERMLEVTQNGDDIILRNNDGGNNLTVFIGFGRKECGADDAPFEEVVSDLYRMFNKNVGVSFESIHDEDDWDDFMKSL